jgi:single-stranded DNA-binding protein
MMATITGPLDRDPGIRYSRDGNAVTTLAVHDATAGHVEVVVRGAMAENAALSFTRGNCVVAIVQNETVAYAAEDGRSFTRSESVAEEVAASVATATVDIRTVTRLRPA